MNYRLGLDIGIASVGWAVVRTNSKDEPCGIERMGVRVFDKAEVPKTGDSLASARRAARCGRRRLRRRRHRIDRVEWLMERSGIIEQKVLEERFQSGTMSDVYEARVRALDSRVTDEELAQILVFMVKHRGFKSTRKADAKDKEGGAVLNAVHENEKRMQEKGYRTIGEMIYCDEKFHTLASWSAMHYLHTPRNKDGKYEHTILRVQLEREIKLILERQQEFGNEKITGEFVENYMSIFNGQRSFDKGPGEPSPYAGSLIENMVGNCTFERQEKRAAKSTYTAQKFQLLQKLNHTSILSDDGSIRRLSDEEREHLIIAAFSKEKLTYADIRKILGLSNTDKFMDLNYQKDWEETENKTKYVSLKDYYEIKKVAPEFIREIERTGNYQLLDDVERILTCYKEDGARKDAFIDLDIDSEVVDQLLVLSPVKFGHLSVLAMSKIIPYLEQGMIYNEACEAAGYDYKNEQEEGKSKYLTHDAVQEMLEDIPNPVVCRAITQTVKVINAIIREYGSPVAVHVELAREMAKNFEERKKLQKNMEDNASKNEKIKKEIQELGFFSPTGRDIVKYKLWKEQGERCMYSGDPISVEQLFSHGYAEVDHVIPYSISFDDSYKNKVLVKKEHNQAKGNRIPYEYFGSNESWWNDYEARVRMYIKDYKKQQILLKKKFTEEERRSFKERNLVDTKYITVAVAKLIKRNLEMAPYDSPNKKQKVFTVNGAVTDYLKKRWALPQKDRRTDKHHALDALVVACTTQGMIQKISMNVQAREMEYARDYVILDEETGEIYDRGRYSREEWDDLFGKKFPLPWELFRYEAAAFMAEEPEVTGGIAFEGKNTDNVFDRSKSLLVEELIRRGYRKDEEEEIYIPPIFVSRMTKHKVTGAGHKDTVRSGKLFKEEGKVISKVALADLKLKDGEIPNYYDKESDLLLYNALVRELKAHDGEGKKAFPEGTEFHKPKADGTPGPVVKKVKLYDKQTVGVEVNGGAGVCENGSMVRIDLFRENGKYYFVPIYTKDIVKKELPMRAATQAKKYNEWRMMKDECFLFSLYPGDLFEVVQKKGKMIKAITPNKEKVEKESVLSYFAGANISTASISGESHDKSYSFESLGVQSLASIRKFQVDVLGNFHEVKQEKRQSFADRKPSKIYKK